MRQNLFKRLNRGVLLAVLFSVGMILFVSVDAVSFQKETIQIEQAVREYVEQSPQMAILSPPYNKIGSEADAGAVTQKMAENEAFLRKYWSFQEDGQGYNQSRVMLDQIRAVVEYNAQGKGLISSAKGIVQYIHSVRRVGFRRAEVSFSYTGSVKYLGDVQWVLFGTSLQTGAAMNSSPRTEEKVTPGGDVTAVLVKLDGSWKIDSVEVSSMSLN